MPRKKSKDKEIDLPAREREVPTDSDELAELNKEIIPSTITLYLPPEFDKRLLPVKAKGSREWWEEDDKTVNHARFCLPLTMASGLGYYILSPATFTVEWDGDRSHDATITIHDGASHAVIDAHSARGAFTIQSSFVVRTKGPGDFVYIKGVANQYRKPYQILEAMIEAWWSPAEFGIVGLINQPGSFTIKRGEPIAQMFVTNVQQAQYGLSIIGGSPPRYQEWSDKRYRPDYTGKDLDYLKGLWPDGAPACPHFKGWTEEIIHKEPDSLSPSEYWTAGEQAQESGNHAEALRQFNLAIQTAVDRDELTEHQLYKFYTVGRHYLDRADLANARIILQKCIVLNQRSFDAPTTIAATLCTDLAYCYRATGDLDSAIQHYSESLNLRRAQSEPPLNLARALVDLGTCYDAKKLYKQAEPLLQEALELCNRDSPPEDPFSLYCRCVMACLLSHQKKFDEAQELFDQVKEARIRIHGAESPEVATICNDLGFHYMAMKRYEEAESEFTKALEIRKNGPAGEGLEVASLHENLAFLLKESGQPQKAKQHFLAAIAIGEKTLLPSDPLIRRTYAALGWLYHELGDVKLANQCMGRAGHGPIT